MQQNWTGERLEAAITGDVLTEHLHRYAIALAFARGKKVLDLACGEGYGSCLLATTAAFVHGIDIDEPCIQQAAKKYTLPNLVFSCNPADRLPLPDASVDLITCFETLEHLDDHLSLLQECKRVLAKDGLLIISTPEKKNYSDDRQYRNPFHKKELYETGFRDLMTRFFRNNSFYYQQTLAGSLLTPADSPGCEVVEFYSGDRNQINKSASGKPMYLLAFCSDSDLPAVPCSVFRATHTAGELAVAETERLKKTLTYRLGNWLLYPFKTIRNRMR